MTRDQALYAIVAALKEVDAPVDETLSENTDLIQSGLLDSLDSMNFLFELEKSLNCKISEIDETFDDFKVGTIVDVLVNY
jgi:acyl carrier protein